MKKYVIALDQSTSASKVFLLDKNGSIVRRFSKEHKQYYPAPGYVEHDADEIYRNVAEGIRTVIEGIPTQEIACLSISNQRETTVLWDRQSGLPVCPAVVWQDVRGAYITEELKAHAEEVHRKTGIFLSPYFPAAKAAAVFRENPELLKRAQAGEICVGTVDSYLIYRLTACSAFLTDVSNAGRTQLMDLKKRTWDKDLAKLFGIPEAALAKEILLSDAVFGEIRAQGLPAGIRIVGVMGDSHAALFGNGCHAAGMAKATYGTGSSVMLNVGDTPVLSSHGLSASVGFGREGQVCYVLEGNVTCSGDTLIWLRDEMKLIDSVKEVEAIAASVPDSGGVQLIPAFSGLGAPYFDNDARAIICGITRGTTRAHVIRAALESIAQQDADVLDAMKLDFGAPVREIYADGGPASNQLLMQFQADMGSCKVTCASASELSALGAGYMGGLASGLYDSFETIEERRKETRSYIPMMSETERAALRNSWKAAVAQACVKQN